MEKVEKSEKVEKVVNDAADTKKATEILEREKRERIGNCSKEIIEVLKKYNCDFDVSMILRQGGILPNINIVAK